MLFAELEAHSDPKINSAEVQNLIMTIVEHANRLVLVDTLTTALASSATLDPGLKIHLPSAFKKLGRYFSASHDLVAAARNPKYSVFSKLSSRRSSILLTQEHRDSKLRDRVAMRILRMIRYRPVWNTLRYQRSL